VRVQIHKADKDIKVFTRRLHDVTSSVPEIVEAIARLPVKRLIIDGETLALGKDGKPYSFQTTMRRFGRKTDVDHMRKTLPLSVMFFDCLYLDGEELIDRPAQERFANLEHVLPKSLIIPRLVTNEDKQAEQFFQEALNHGHEGVMAKALDALYEAGNRGSSWLKVKPAVTLDLVVLAAEWGYGRREGWLSNLHLGARDPNGGFVMLGKTFKGMTDQMLEWQTKKFSELAIGQDEYTVYVRPEVVVEVAFNEIQVSSQYPGGLSLRFARVKRYRPDKKPQDADTMDTVRNLFKKQTSQFEKE
jgi:DNA ligase-1